MTFPLVLRSLKSWISPDFCIILQVQNPWAREDELQPKKTHLILDLKQLTFGVRISHEKPEDAHANHAFVQILRKHCPHFSIKDIFEISETQDIIIPLLSGEASTPPWYLLLTRSRPPLASLVGPDALIYVSHGQKGTFTKKHALPQPLPDLATAKNILADLRPQSKVDFTEASAKKDSSSDNATDEAAFSKAQKELIQRLKRKHKTVKKTLEKILKNIPLQAAVTQLEREAQLLQTYAYLIKPDQISLRLEPVHTGEEAPITLTLNPELSPGQTIEQAFIKARKARRSFSMGITQADEAQTGIHSLEQDLADLRARVKNESELQVLHRRYKLPDLTSVTSSSVTEKINKPYKIYMSSLGHKILVGKGAHENDELTKSAKGNDYWIHAVGSQGSHIIIPCTADIRQAIPTKLLREAAILALHFSKLRDEQAGECYVTRKGKIKKHKGMPPGLWNVEHSETIFFRYEQAELQEILETVRI